MSAVAAPQQSSLNTPSFFASAFMEMNIFEQCFNAAAPSDVKNAPTNSANPTIASASTSTATQASSGISASLAPTPVSHATPPSPPPISPKAPTMMDGFNPSDFTVPNVFNGPPDPSGNPRSDLNRRYEENRWSVPMDATVPPSMIQPHLSPPYSPRSGSPTDKFVPPGALVDGSLSPLHNMLVNYPNETRSHDDFDEDYDNVVGSGTSIARPEVPSQNTRGGATGARQSRGSNTSRTGAGRGHSRRSKKSTMDDDSAKEAKRQKFLERNRIAASKCRRKKKQWTQNLEESARDVQTTSRQLHKQVSALRDELLHLKGELLKHNGCQCERIKQFLMNEATRVVEGSAAASAAAATGSSSSSLAPSTTASRSRQMSQGSDLGFGVHFDDFSDTSSARFNMESQSPKDCP